MPTKKNLTRVVLIDDHPLIREGLRQLLEREDHLSVVGEAEDIPQALEVLDKTQPDLAIVDLSLKGASGLELIKQIRTKYPNMVALVVSMFEEALYAERAMRAGAQGYVMKQEATHKVVEAIGRVMQGDLYVSEALASKLLNKLLSSDGESAIAKLSDRELEVFDLFGQGHTTREIAEKLELSVHTIETYRANMKRKLGLRNSNELVQRAVQWVQSKVS